MGKKAAVHAGGYKIQQPAAPEKGTITNNQLRGISLKLEAANPLSSKQRDQIQRHYMQTPTESSNALENLIHDPR